MRLRGYSALNAFRRARQNFRDRRAAETEHQQWRDSGTVEPSLQGAPRVAPAVASPVAPSARQEPPLVAERRAITIGGREPAFEDEADDYAEEPPFIANDDGDMYEAPTPSRPTRGPAARVGQAPASPPQAAPRVAAPAPRPQPGNRAQREAQGNLLE